MCKTLNQPVYILRTKRCQQALEEAMDCPRQLRKGCWISAATALGWHQPKFLSEEFVQFLLGNDQNAAATALPAQLHKLSLPEPTVTPPNQAVTPNNIRGELFLLQSLGGNTTGMGTFEWGNTKTCLKRFWQKKIKSGISFL